MMMTLAKTLTLTLITATIVAAFVTVPPLAAMQAGGDASRLFYFHVPMAQASFFAFVAAAGLAIAYLRTRKSHYAASAAVAAEIGLIFSVVALVTGALWAKQAWGAYWNWDPRQLFLFALILFYGAFFALRQATVNPEARNRLSSVYLIFGGALSPFLFFVLPRLYRSLHEDANQVVMQSSGGTMSPLVRTVFIGSTVGFLCLGLWLFKLGVDVSRMESGGTK